MLRKVIEYEKRNSYLQPCEKSHFTPEWRNAGARQQRHEGVKWRHHVAE